MSGWEDLGQAHCSGRPGQRSLPPGSPTSSASSCVSLCFQRVFLLFMEEEMEGEEM